MLSSPIWGDGIRWQEDHNIKTRMDLLLSLRRKLSWTHSTAVGYKTNTIHYKLDKYIVQAYIACYPCHTHHTDLSLVGYIVLWSAVGQSLEWRYYNIVCQEKKGGGGVTLHITVLLWLLCIIVHSKCIQYPQVQGKHYCHDLLLHCTYTVRRIRIWVKGRAKIWYSLQL